MEVLFPGPVLGDGILPVLYGMFLPLKSHLCSLGVLLDPALLLEP